MDLLDTVRLLAMGNMVPTDAGMACFDSKYTYRFWRPITAIRNADIDGNHATIADPTWSPLTTTPNHPEYPSQHGCSTGALAQVLAHAVGSNEINATIWGATAASPTGLVTSRTYPTVKPCMDELVNARVWIGFHFRSSVIGARTSERRLRTGTLSTTSSRRATMMARRSSSATLRHARRFRGPASPRCLTDNSRLWRSRVTWEVPVEHSAQCCRPSNPRVAGSNPAGGATRDFAPRTAPAAFSTALSQRIARRSTKRRHRGRRSASPRERLGKSRGGYSTGYRIGGWVRPPTAIERRIFGGLASSIEPNDRLAQLGRRRRTFVMYRR